MYGKIKEHLQQELASIQEAGLFKKERIIATSQDAVIKLIDGSEVPPTPGNNQLDVWRFWAGPIGLVGPRSQRVTGKESFTGGVL